MGEQQEPSGGRRCPGAFTRFNRQNREKRESLEVSKRLKDDLIAKFQAAGMSRKEARKEAGIEIGALDIQLKRSDKGKIDQRIFDDLVELYEKNGYDRETALEEAKMKMAWLSRDVSPGSSYSDWF